MTNSGWSVFAIKGIGALAGTVLSVAIWHPRSILDGLSRTAVGVIGGVVFGPVAKAYAGNHVPGLTEVEATIASAAAVAALAWPMIGAGYRVIDNYKKKDAEKDGS